MLNYYLSKKEATEILVDFLSIYEDTLLPFWALRLMEHFDIDEDEITDLLAEDSEDFSAKRLEILEDEDFAPLFED